MRAEAGQRRNVANRRRNDSMNSTQSEYVPQYYSFESIGSFDWSQEVESEYNAKHGDEHEENNDWEQDKSENRNIHNNSPANDYSHGDYSHPRPRRGLLRLPLGLRSDRDRDGHDSDHSSSIPGSIVEEDYEADDISSGDVTPTEDSGDERHWTRQSGFMYLAYFCGYSFYRFFAHFARWESSLFLSLCSESLNSFLIINWVAQSIVVVVESFTT
ncbi:unnamed protein product [Cylicostephanus goldi]|uniref:Uncharacterized protein n=1 Tax=Cylicostephanus goldi TaxID=71465 RepID=A0A3P7M5V5_CYLGO|nr:unnamed protein product [Cylicostephanus goldi]